jgi:hypothetical protein
MIRKRVEMCLTHIFTIFVLEMGRGSFETSILAKEIESLKPIVMIGFLSEALKLELVGANGFLHRVERKMFFYIVSES